MRVGDAKHSAQFRKVERESPKGASICRRAEWHSQSLKTPNVIDVHSHGNQPLD